MLRLGKQVIVFDGGFGSEIEKRGLGGIPEELNITHAEEIKAIHRSYACADCISANTFGLNRIKYKGRYTLKELAFKAIENARSAGKKVFFDIGPTGAMLKPLGTLSFDEAYEAFAEIVEMTKDAVDGYIAETFSDLYEIKACILAVKEHTDKPLFATMTFDGTGRTLTGSTPEIVVNTLEGLGADAIGVNCSLGPKELEGIVSRMLACSSVPVIVQPNRGLPELKDGKTVYTLGLEEFDRSIEKLIDMGVSVVGGCCGTTPQFIQAISRFSGRKVNRPAVAQATVINSATKAVTIDGVKICGERLNPTGKKKLKEALLAGDYG
ncbi:MAG: homocysteine S-methyltransferase family protein, partial [Clostridia bacterium]|nr:homocysteine S-methyltransferase family protein [Clostridia bacterium]